MEILSAEVGYQKMANNLLQMLPEPVEGTNASYSSMHFYVKHLADVGEEKPSANLVLANVYTRRSATFRNLKRELTKATESKDKA